MKNVPLPLAVAAIAVAVVLIGWAYWRATNLGRPMATGPRSPTDLYRSYSPPGR